MRTVHVRTRGDGQVALSHLEHEIEFLFTFDDARFNRIDESSPVMRVNDGLADLESHVSRAPSASTSVTRTHRCRSDACWIVLIQ